MANVNSFAQSLCDEICKYGTAELTYATSVFTGEKSENARIKGAINGKLFRVMMFDSSAELSLPCVSAHFSLDLNDSRLSMEHIGYWNAENRFTKVYHEDDDTYLAMDSFLTDEQNSKLMQSVVKIWATALKSVARLKTDYERTTGLV